MKRRPRNEISRNDKLAAACADLLDDGATDASAAKALSASFERKVTARTVRSFRKATWQAVADERMRRRDAAREVSMILDAARGSGATFVEAGTDLLSKMLYDLIRKGGEEIDPIKIGAMLAKLREVENDSIRVRILQERERQATQLKAAVGDRKASPDELIAKVDEIMGIKR